MIIMNFGERLRQIRTENGLKQIDLAKHLFVQRLNKFKSSIKLYEKLYESCIKKENQEII